MGNKASVLNDVTMSYGNTSISASCVLPIGEAAYPRNLIDEIHEPGKPSSGLWFHAVKHRFEPSKFVTLNGVRTCIQGETHAFYLNTSFSGPKDRLMMLIPLGCRRYSISAGYNPNIDKVDVSVDLFEMKEAYMSSSTQVTYKYGSKSSQKFYPKTLTAQEVYANAWQYIVDANLSVTTWRSQTIYTSSYRYVGWSLDPPLPSSRLSFDYKHNELANWQCIKDLDLIPHHLTPGLSAAYVDCVKDIPNSQMNLMENCRDLLGAIRTLITCITTKSVTPLVKALTNPLRDPRDSWMTYRYVVNTSRMDLEDVKELTLRLADLQALKSQHITLRGSFIEDDILYRCSVTYELCDILPQGLNDKLRTYGLRLSLENVWDLIPFSFVVDWFAHIGDFLANADAIILSQQYKPVSIWYSYESSYKNQAIYTRFPGPPLYNAPLMQYHESSSKTWAMRVADTISIISR